jgi:2-amino-4-hydroxy-6-hydroxymethyldihydropteridine diphosphokinase
VEAALAAAVRALAAALGPVAVAPLYRSLPRSVRNLDPQPPYLNTVLLAAADRPPEDLLALGKALERAAGRRRGPRHGPRPLDVDLLLWGDRVSSAPELTLPHPSLADRRFVLAPLADLAPDLPVPPAGETVAALLARVGQEGEVERIGWSGPPPAPARYPPPPESGSV